MWGVMHLTSAAPPQQCTGRRPPVVLVRAHGLPCHVRCATATVVKPKLCYIGVRAAALASEGISSGRGGGWALLTAEALPPPPITKSDAAFAAEGLEFVFGHDNISLSELNDLFERVGFPKRDPGRLSVALANTHCTMWIRCTRGSRWARLGQLLGFARATSDKALTATIWDVAINPAWQKSGLGRGVVERLTAALVRDGITTITLFAEPGVVGLYEKLGFVREPSGVQGMAFQRSSPAGGALMLAR